MNKLNSDAASVLSCGGRDFNLFDIPADYYANPVPYWRALRDDDPMHWNEDGSLLLTRYDDVKTVWRDLSGKVDRAGAYRKKFGEGPLLEHHTTSMLFRDPPDHDRLRSIVDFFFNQASVERMRAGVQEIVANLLDEIEEKRQIDFVADFSSRIPVQVICDIFGVDRSDGPVIRDLGAQVLLPLNPAVGPEVIAAGHEATAKFGDYLLEHINAWRRRDVEEVPTNIISALVAAEKKGVQISEAEMIHMCILLLNGGQETTTNLIGLSTLALIQHPSEVATMTGDPSKLGPAIEECIRYCSPLQLQGRRTTREVKIPSGVVPPDTEVIIAQGSANRDDRVFKNADELELGRTPNPHLAFGAGIHVCIGRMLARMELRVVLPALMQRFPSIELNGLPSFNRNARFRGIQSMPVTVR